MKIISERKLKADYPRCFQLLTQSYKFPNQSLNSILDDFLYKYGLGIVVLPVLSGNQDFLGFSSTIKIYPHNKLNKTAEEIKVVENYKKYKNSDKVQKITTIQALNLLEEYFSWTI